jgi:Mg-chelatase subunit ChlD
MKAATALVMLAFVLHGPSIQAQELESHYVILVDDSASNPMVRDTAHATRVAKDMMREISAFHMRDRITIAPLGRFGDNPIVEAEVDKRFPPEKATQTVQAMIGSFPEAVNSILGGPAPITHIQGALQLAASRVNCTQTRTVVFVLSDGQETGDKLRAQPLFQGCEALTIIGVIGKTPSETASIGSAWMQWCKNAGFRRCKVIN